MIIENTTGTTKRKIEVTKNDFKKSSPTTTKLMNDEKKLKRKRTAKINCKT